MSNIIYPKYKLPNNLNITSLTASSGITGSFIGDGSKLINIPSSSVDLSEYATLTGVSGTFVSASELNEYATLTGVSGTFVSQSQLSLYPTLTEVSSTFISESQLSPYATLSGVSGTFVSQSQLDSYATLTGVSGTFVSQSQIVNFITGVFTDPNFNGSGVLSSPISLASTVSLGFLSASDGISASHFYGDGSNIINLPIPDIKEFQTLYVAPDGLDSNIGSITKPFKTVQYAINYASSSINHTANVVIKLAPGTYAAPTVTRRNTYFRSTVTKNEQRAVNFDGQTLVSCSSVISGTYNNVVGFEGIFFSNSNNINSNSTFKISTNQYTTYLKDCYVYASSNTGSSCVELDNNLTTGVNGSKFVIQNCVFYREKSSADIVKVGGGYVKADSCEFYYSALSGSGNAISQTGGSIVSDRLFFDLTTSGSAVSSSVGFGTYTPGIYLSNSSIAISGSANIIKNAGHVFLSNVLLNGTGGSANNIVGIAGSLLSYQSVTSLDPTRALNITNSTLIPLSENHAIVNAYSINSGPIYSTSVTSSYLTGAHLGTFSGSAVTASNAYLGYLDFNTSSYAAPNYPGVRVARTFYNVDSGDLSTYLDTNGLYINNGQQLVQKCKNQTGSPLNKGTIVHISGTTGTDIPRIITASWDSDTYSANTVGLVMNTSITNGSDGYVLLQGTLTEIDLSGLSGLNNGQILYLSSSGQITNIKPVAPKHMVSIGQVIAKASPGNNATVYVKIQNGYEIDELHDVQVSSKLNGDLLSWDSGSAVWKNTKQLNGSYEISGSLELGSLLKAPLTTKLSNDPGSAGQICWDVNYIYVCVSDNIWKSSSLN